MALTATIYAFTIDLSDMDRGVYETFDLRVAQQPSETAEYMLARVLAYCLEYTEGIAFTQGIAAGQEPAIAIRDLTGRLTTWIDVGMPDADRLHRASKSTDRVVIYTHRNVAMLKQQLAGKTVHRADEIAIYEFERPLLDTLAGLIERRTALGVVKTEGQLFIEVAGQSVSGRVIEHSMR
ncbi:MAG: YaeQ family protein [Roseiflexaceae bacterium]|nr:YaeQ family protein [Roseiflexaceae bacterium]